MTDGGKLSMKKVTVHLPPPCAPFSTVERGKGSPRRRFYFFGCQQHWILWGNDSKYMTKYCSESYTIPVLKVLGGLGSEVCRTANFMQLHCVQCNCCSYQEAPRHSSVPYLNCNQRLFKDVKITKSPLTIGQYHDILALEAIRKRSQLL